MSALSPQDIQRALISFGTATIHEAQGQKGAVDSAIRALDPTKSMAGPAFTVKCRPGDNLALHYALSKSKAGQVLVVDAGGFVEAGPWGDIMTLAAQVRGLAGLVIDGSVRDSAMIIEMGFPVFSRGVSIKGTEKRQIGQVGCPIVVGGIQIRNDDMVVGDRDGLVVVAAEELSAVLAASQKRVEGEEEARRQIRAGRTTVDLIGAHEKLRTLGMY